MPNGMFELCAVDGEVLGQRSGAAAAEHVQDEALDDEDEFEADLDLGATMSDRCNDARAAAPSRVSGVSHLKILDWKTRALKHEHTIGVHRTTSSEHTMGLGYKSQVRHPPVRRTLV